MNISKIKTKMNKWVAEGEAQKKDFFERLAVEDGGNLNIDPKQFINETILPFITRIMARIKPG